MVYLKRLLSGCLPCWIPSPFCWSSTTFYSFLEFDFDISRTLSLSDWEVEPAKPLLLQSFPRPFETVWSSFPAACRVEVSYSLCHAACFSLEGSVLCLIVSIWLNLHILLPLFGLLISANLSSLVSIFLLLQFEIYRKMLVHGGIHWASWIIRWYWDEAVPLLSYQSRRLWRWI